MRCPSCGFENPEGLKFCNECGSALTRRCPQCGFANAPQAKFCGECGTTLSQQSSVPSAHPPVSYTPPHLAERILAEQAAMEARGATDGERKTLTTIFADLKGSTALIEGLDPEDARAILDPALRLMMDAVHRYEGYVAQALGDGILALFGAPIAHEDHPQRALYAALRMQEAMRRYADTLDIGMVCRVHAAWGLWLLGYPAQALQRGQEGMTLAYESSHPYSLGFALWFTAQLHQFRREGRLTQERAEAAMALSAEQGFAILSQAAILRGWALAEQGQGKDGMTQIQQSLAAYRATGAELLRPFFLALLAETYGKAGQAEEGLAALAEALTVVDKTGEHFYEAELYRLTGQLTLQQFKVQSSKFKVPSTQHPTPSTQSEAEECFQRAIEVARKQQAKSLELRAAMSLSRLWQQRGKREEARQMLAKIYGWFTEGFDTKDLQEAKALLEELQD